MHLSEANVHNGKLPQLQPTGCYVRFWYREGQYNAEAEHRYNLHACFRYRIDGISTGAMFGVAWTLMARSSPFTS